MRIIARSRLMAMANACGDCVAQVADWYNIASKADWRNVSEVRRTFRHIELGGDETVFDIKGDGVRIVVHIRYDTGAIYVRDVCAPPTSRAAGSRDADFTCGGSAMTANWEPAVEEEYLSLVRAFPLISIRDDAHLAEALRVADELLDQSVRSPAQEAYLGALADLVEIYERSHVAIPPASGVDAVRHLLEANGLTPADLAPLLGSPAIVSEVLAGKRRLTLPHIKKLAAHFGLPADVFLDQE